MSKNYSLMMQSVSVSLIRGLHVITPSNIARGPSISSTRNVTTSRAALSPDLSVQPNHGWAHHLLGAIAQECGHHEDACAHFQQATK